MGSGPRCAVAGAAYHLPMASGEHLWQPGWHPRWLEPALPAGPGEPCGVQHRHGVPRPWVGRSVPAGAGVLARGGQSEAASHSPISFCIGLPTQWPNDETGL